MHRSRSKDSSTPSEHGRGPGIADSTEIGVSEKQLIRERRLQGVRAIAKVALIACTISIPFCAGIMYFLDFWLGAALLGITVVVGIYEAMVLSLSARGRYRSWFDWLGAAVEISVPTVIALIDSSRVGAAYALTSAPTMLYGLVVLVSALRLRPGIVLFAGGLGAAQILALFAVLQSRIDPILLARLPSLGVSNILQRATYVFLAGIVGWFLCRSLLRLAHDLSTQWVAGQQSEQKRRALEEQLHQAQKMEAIGQLAGGVAHDFNNALTTILGYCEFLEEAIKEPDLREDVAEIRRAGERAVALTSQLLAFSRKQTFQTRVVDLNTLVSNAGRMLERMVGEGVELRFFQGGGLLSVQVDPNRLEQVLVNLVINARDSMKGGGVVKIETGRTSEHTSGMSAPKNGWVFLTVVDSGEGMTPEVQARLFEPFFTTKERGKGTGLGLATAYGAVKQFGGHLFVESTQGRGSTFRILLPMSDVQPVVEETTPRPKSEGGGETILVVEDEKDLRRFVVRVLKRAGYVVLSAEDGTFALETACRYKEKIHLLLTDIVMPGRTGKELWDELRPLRPGTRVVFMSGYAQNILGEHVSLESDTPFLPKPFSAAELECKIREVLELP
jgi:signal transduction histidine kinase